MTLSIVATSTVNHLLNKLVPFNLFACVGVCVQHGKLYYKVFH